MCVIRFKRLLTSSWILILVWFLRIDHLVTNDSLLPYDCVWFGNYLVRLFALGRIHSTLTVKMMSVYWKLRPFTFSLSLVFQGMMIDEADEFVTGPQNKGKRPADNSNVPGGGPKRRRCMSPLLRLGRAYTPPVTPPASPRHTTGKTGRFSTGQAPLFLLLQFQTSTGRFGLIL